MTFEYQGAGPVVSDVCFEVPRNSTFEVPFVGVGICGVGTYGVGINVPIP